jgi:hypothetical protein
MLDTQRRGAGFVGAGFGTVGVEPAACGAGATIICRTCPTVAGAPVGSPATPKLMTVFAPPTYVSLITPPSTAVLVLNTT